jgi:tellurite resistance protein TerC
MPLLARMEVSVAHWMIFILAVLFFLALDLGVFHRQARVVRFKEALTWTTLWFCVAMLFGTVVAPMMVVDWGQKETTEFVTGYLIELSLSMDNVFVIALIFTYFRVPRQFQHRVLFWGILGALVMRGFFIFTGVALIQRFEWLFYVLGVFLVFTGIKMVFAGEEEVHPEKNLAIRLARKFMPVSPDFAGQKFFTTFGGQPALTPLALVLLMVETTDLIFAIDSIPAIFGVTTNQFIVFTSKVFAILGLRSLYFVLAGAVAYFRYLKFGLSLVLVFIGLKMLLIHTEFHVSTQASLVVVVVIIGLSVVASIVAGRKAVENAKPPADPSSDEENKTS